MQSSAEKRKHADLQVIESVPPLKNEILAELLTFKKEELFDLDSMTLKQLIKQIGYKEFTTLYNLNKFELCALNKVCDNFLGILEAAEVLDGTKDHEAFHHDNIPSMDQVKDLSDILAELQLVPANGADTDPNVAQSDQEASSQPIKKLIDQNGDELRAIWSDIGELLFFNKFGEQVYIEGDIPDEFKPPIPEELA